MSYLNSLGRGSRRVIVDFTQDVPANAGPGVLGGEIPNLATAVDLKVFAGAEEQTVRIEYREELLDLLAVIGASRAVVTLRLHALIFATCTQIPAVGIAADGRDEKISAFAAASGQDFLPPDRVTVPTLVDTVLSALSSAPRLSPLLARVSADMRREATEELQRVIDLSKKE